MSSQPSVGRVLVLGDDVRMTLPVVRSLGRKHIKVHVAWAAPDSPIRSSRHVHRFHELPTCRNPCDEWSGPLRSLLQTVPFDLVIPTTEPVVHAVQCRRDDFEPHAQLALLNDELFHVAFDKTAMQHVAEAARISVPAGQIAGTIDEVDGFLSESHGPVVLKPSRSVTARTGGVKQFVQIFEDHPDCRTAAVAMLNSGQTVLLQEFFTGRGVGVEFLARDGRILTAFQHRRIHETTGHGSTYRAGEAVSPELLDATQRILSALSYTGVGMCEFRVNASTREWVFLELNARFWGSLPLACASRADFPWFLYQMLVHDRTEFPQHFVTGLRSRSLRSDLRWIWRAFRGRGKPAHAIREQSHGWRLNTMSRPEIVWNALRMLAPGERFDSLTFDDPGPFLREIADLLTRPFSQRLTRLRRVQQQPPDSPSLQAVRRADPVS